MCLELLKLNNVLMNSFFGGSLWKNISVFIRNLMEEAT